MTSFFWREAYCLDCEHGVRPETSAKAGVAVTPTAIASAAAARACLTLGTAATGAGLSAEARTWSGLGRCGGQREGEARKKKGEISPNGCRRKKEKGDDATFFFDGKKKANESRCFFGREAPFSAKTAPPSGASFRGTIVLGMGKAELEWKRWLRRGEEMFFSLSLSSCSNSIEQEEDERRKREKANGILHPRARTAQRLGCSVLAGIRGFTTDRTVREERAARRVCMAGLRRGGR